MDGIRLDGETYAIRERATTPDDYERTTGDVDGIMYTYSYSYATGVLRVKLYGRTVSKLTGEEAEALHSELSVCDTMDEKQSLLMEYAE